MVHLVELEVVPFAAARVIGKEVRHTIRPGVGTGADDVVVESLAGDGAGRVPATLPP